MICLLAFSRAIISEVGVSMDHGRPWCPGYFGPGDIAFRYGTVTAQATTEPPVLTATSLRHLVAERWDLAMNNWGLLVNVS